MNVSFDNIMSAAALILSIAIGIRSMRKTDSEKRNLDAQTYETYQESLRDSHENYQLVQKALSDLRAEMRKMETEKNEEIKVLRYDLDQIKLKADRLEAHNRALINQLIENSLVPVTIDEALKRRG